MKKSYRGLAAALLVVVLFWGTGCSRSQEIYLAGLESELVSERNKTESEIESDMESDMESATEVSPADIRKDSTGDIQEPHAEPATDAAAGYVHICGAVRHPGVYPLSEGMRVFEVLELAGGFSDEADEQWLNQAETVSDGQRLYVYTKEETAQLEAEGMTAAASSAGLDGQTDVPEQKININTADREVLMTLPGIGEAKADAIISYREDHGGFDSVEEIQNISGIKAAVFSKIKDRITV